jgi:hypothetical protein
MQSEPHGNPRPFRTFHCDRREGRNWDAGFTVNSAAILMPANPDPACHPPGLGGTVRSHAEPLRPHSNNSRTKAAEATVAQVISSPLAFRRSPDTERSTRSRDRTIRAGPAAWPSAVDGVRLLPASHSVGRAFRSYEPAIDLFRCLWSRGRPVLRNAPRSLWPGRCQGYLPLEEPSRNTSDLPAACAATRIRS